MGTGGAGANLGANGANGIPGSGFGGAIYNSTGVVTVLFCTFNSNTAAGAGGGDGKSGAGDGKGSPGDSGSNAGGGGIYDRGGSLTATNCTFAGNSATGGAGGAGGAGGTQGFGGDGGNGGPGGGAAGGGVDNVDGGTAVLVNCTLTDNGAQGGTGGAGGTAGNSFTHAGSSGQAGTSAGGGIAAGSGTITLKNTLLGYSVAGENGQGNVSDGGNNLSDDASVPLPAAGSHTNVTSLLLGTLGNNGGPTWTVPIISSNSPAVDAGNDAAAAPIDQRHQTRVGRSDIGAFEFNGVAAPARLIISLKTNLVVVSWTNTLYSYSLQSATNLLGHSWSYVTNTPAAVSNQFVLTNSADGPSRFYRLIK